MGTRICNKSSGYVKSLVYFLLYCMHFKIKRWLAIYIKVKEINLSHLAGSPVVYPSLLHQRIRFQGPKGASSSVPVPPPVLPTLCRCAAVLRLTSTIMSEHFFFSSFTVRLSDPTALTASDKLAHSFFFLLLLIPEDRFPNKILFLVSTSDSSTSNSFSVKFHFLLALAMFLQVSFAKLD